MSRKKMGDARRKQILEGLLAAVAERGLRDCSMSDVAEAAGVSKGILHYYFKNKDEMIGALVAHLRDSNLMDFLSQTKQIEDPLEQLRTSLWYPVQAFGHAAGGAGVVLAKVWIEFWGLSAHHADVHNFILGIQDSLRAHFKGILETGIESGVFAGEVDPEKTASVILAAMEGLVLQWHFNKESFSFAAELKAFEHMLERTLHPGGSSPG